MADAEPKKEGEQTVKEESSNENGEEDSIFQHIDEMREKNPLIGAQLGAKGIYNVIFNAFRDPQGRLNAEILLFFMSSLAGMSCQMAAWECIREKQISMEQGMMQIQTTIGKVYYMGNLLNFFLLEKPGSAVEVISSIYKQWFPNKDIPDLKKYLTSSVENIGKEDYKIWGLISPFDMTKSIKEVWDSFENQLRKYCKSVEEWPILFGLALMLAMNDCTNAVDKDKCFDMAMEALLYMAKMDYN